ncbi:MAG: phage virion morphogenesis protein [Synergistaceae bacterium]|nr:phage virion morphogenesis protein [Synergistaceae bacterium]
MRISGQASGINETRREIQRLIGKLTRMKKYFSQVGRYVQSQTIHERFDKEQAPSGEKWKPLSSSRVKQRMKRHKSGNMKILQDTGELRRSIKYQADDEGVTIGSSLNYAKLHQFGGTITAKREGTYKHNYSKTKREGERYSYTRQVRIPARPYLGITQPEVDHIKELLIQYLKRGG